MPEQATVASTPDPAIGVLVGTIVRAVLQIASGFGMAWALAVTADQLAMIISVLTMMAATGWSLYQKVMTARREHQIAVASARGGKAVQPESTPI